MTTRVQTFMGVCQCGHIWEDHSEDWTLGNGDMVDKCLICCCVHYMDETERTGE